MTSRYIEIYQQLKTEIIQDKYPIGSFLPSESRMADRFNCSRDTIRKSLLRLGEDGYIQKQHGRGSQVLHHNLINFPISGLTSFQELKQGQKLNASTRVAVFEEIQSTAANHQLTAFPIGSRLYHVVRVRFINGSPSVIDEDYFDQKIVSKLTPEIAAASIYDYLENQVGLKIAYAEKSVTATLVTDQDRKLMPDLPKYENRLIQIESRVHLADTTYFQHTISRHRPDKFQFHEFSRRQKIN
ncbi:MAG: trehalose operon repressor [Oenococcus sp.]|uniref:trehalose operon repressor n=1 Tax=Oenococcus TaxID=46254 RepID=UPI0021E8CDFE|nr:trehalose operon repressor [Oenococcus kitaharae]MCV3296459.1 trehalose operon repressor [Oenococcus kitaharae]